MIFKRKSQDETAVAATETDEDEYVPEKRGIGKIFNIYKSVKSGINHANTLMDFINDFKKNKHHVVRRLNMIFLFLTMIFAVVAGLNFILGGTLEKVTLGWKIAVYCVFALYALTVIGIFIAEAVYRRNVTVKTTKTYNRVLCNFQRFVRAISLVMSVLTFTITLIVDDIVGKTLAANVIVQILSVIMFIFSLSSSISKSVIKFVNWLKSPVNKRQFRFVATEWYGKLNSDNKNDRGIKAVKRVKVSRVDGAQKAIDNYLIKSLGKKYVHEIKSCDVLAAVEEVPEEDRDDVEGTVKQIFEYAVERGIISESPCDKIELHGNLGKDLKRTDKGYSKRQKK